MSFLGLQDTFVQDELREKSKVLKEKSEDLRRQLDELIVYSKHLREQVETIRQTTYALTVEQDLYLS